MRSHRRRSATAAASAVAAQATVPTVSEPLAQQHRTSATLPPASEVSHRCTYAQHPTLTTCMRTTCCLVCLGMRTDEALMQVCCLELLREHRRFVPQGKAPAGDQGPWQAQREVQVAVDETAGDAPREPRRRLELSVRQCKFRFQVCCRLRATWFLGGPDVLPIRTVLQDK